EPSDRHGQPEQERGLPVSFSARVIGIVCLQPAETHAPTNQHDRQGDEHDRQHDVGGETEEGHDEPDDGDDRISARAISEPQGVVVSGVDALLHLRGDLRSQSVYVAMTEATTSRARVNVLLTMRPEYDSNLILHV